MYILTRNNFNYKRGNYVRTCINLLMFFAFWVFSLKSKLVLFNGIWTWNFMTMFISFKKCCATFSRTGDSTAFFKKRVFKNKKIIFDIRANFSSYDDIMISISINTKILFEPSYYALSCCSSCYIEFFFQF